MSLPTAGSHHQIPWEETLFRRIGIATAIATAAALGGGSALAQGSPRITPETLPTPGGSGASATAVNDAGQVVGTSQTLFSCGRADIWTRGVDIAGIPGAVMQPSSAAAPSERGQGVGSLGGAGTKRFAGVYNPGNSPGQATLEGAGAFDGGALPTALVGLAAGTQHDKRVFDDARALRGGMDLNVVLLDGYGPVPGDRFDLFDWNGSLGADPGSFGELRLTALAGDLVWDVSRLYLTGELGVTAMPEPQTWLPVSTGITLDGVHRRHGPKAGALGCSAPHSKEHA